MPFSGPKKYRSWSKERPLWWILYRTDSPGSFNENDKKKYEGCKGRYIILLDHTQDAKARELATYLLDHCDHFVAAKVSKFARDGEKTLVLLADDDSRYNDLKTFAQQWNMQLISFKALGDLHSHEVKANADWALYVERLKRAFTPPS